MRREQNHDDWNPSPWWAKRLRNMILLLAMQNEVILAELHKRPSKLTPEEQKAVNEIFEIEAADRAAIDAATSKK